jgi:putative flavoprotein involved in K+ transport
MTDSTINRRTSSAVDVVVIGAGHAGLAMSYALSQRSIDHVVLERGEIANSWRHERWDSMRLLTPNWQSRLPGYVCPVDDPDGFMTAPEVVDFIASYATIIGAPVRTGTTVLSVTARPGGYCVNTDRESWNCRAVVVASGAHNVATVPSAAAMLPATIKSITAREYRNPNQLDDRRVLIVGASATGIQLADEIARTGRNVTLAVGEHIRMPRRYRGFDIQLWLGAIGVLDERYDAVDDIGRARNLPSPQLIGTADHATLDLNALTERGVNLVGRMVGANGGKLQFSGSLRNHCAMADLKQNRLLGRIDAWIENNNTHASLLPREQFAATLVEAQPRLSVDLEREKFGTVIWATGFRPDYSWLHVPVLDHKGRLRHEGGIVDVPGLYALGLNFMRRRKSSFIHGAEDDVRDLSAHLAAFLRQGKRARLRTAKPTLDRLRASHTITSDNVAM